MTPMKLALLLGFLLGLAAADANDDYCHHHGSVTCKCNRGFSGPNCDTPIDFCNSRINGLSGDLTIGDVCSRHGRCVSTSNGATCLCNYGFQGPFCDTNIQNQTQTLYRCALYNNTYTISNQIRTYCSNGMYCYPDDPNCFKGLWDCPDPLGWCHPLGADMAAKIANLRVSGQPKNQQLATSSNQACSGNGQPTCHCDRGYSGSQCSQTVNFCNGTSALFTSSESGFALCGPHGTCSSSPRGASCTCDWGWSGNLCDQPIPADVTISDRCMPSYYHGDYQHRCSGNQFCLPDNLECQLDPHAPQCDYPIGWCLPKTTALRFINQYKMALKSSKK